MIKLIYLVGNQIEGNDYITRNIECEAKICRQFVYKNFSV